MAEAVLPRQPKLPLVSSEDALAALSRLGCYTPRPAAGSHLAICRDVAGERQTQPLVLNQNPVKRKTLETILAGLRISHEDFMLALGGRHARAVRRRRRPNP